MKIEEKLQGKKSHLRDVFHVKEIGIFGSYSRGDQRKDSDIDILVEFEQGHKDFFNYMRLKYFLEEILGKRVDLVMKKALKQRLKDQILREVRHV